ncbi:MAG: energy-coupling factor transporter transmembrane protein EcfT [Clostridiales bacterium]|nr:energy-coupling factor transporter transmembrane protein EcfT [Clostridiales bacterium]
MTKEFKALRTEDFNAFTFDPRTKLVLIACLSSMAVLMNRLMLLAALFLVSLLLILFFRINVKGVWKRTKALLAVVVFIALAQSLFSEGGQALIRLGSLELLTTGGLIHAGEFILRMLIIITSAAILTTCGSRNVIQGLVQWKLPYEIAFMAALGIRFIPVFGEEFRDAKTAIQLRGIDIKALKIKQKTEVYASLFQPVVAGALVKAKTLSLSMEMRGFRSCPSRVSYRVLRLKSPDYVVMGVALILTAGVLILYYTGF